jgi:hypothetical protein
MDELTRRRLAHNEALFREVNEEIDDRSPSSARAAYVCECADVHCTMTVPLLTDEYRRVRQSPDRFFVVPGHELADLERVVERHHAYLVIEK